jgi:hypothetical protein
VRLAKGFFAVTPQNDEPKIAHRREGGGPGSNDDPRLTSRYGKKLAISLGDAIVRDEPGDGISATDCLGDPADVSDIRGDYEHSPARLGRDACR